MKQDEIIEMARQARLPYYYQDGAIVNLERLEVFAKLVAAKEREEILAMSAKQWFKTQHDQDEAIRARGEA